MLRRPAAGPCRRTLPPAVRLAALGWLVWIELAGAVPAWAYEQYRTGASATSPGCGLRWYEPTLAYQIDAKGAQGLSTAQLEAAVQQAFASWQEVQCSLCGSPDGPGCAPVSCPAQPLGVVFSYQGLAQPTDIGAECLRRDPQDEERCLQVASNGNFVVVVDDPAQWLYGVNVFALTVLTFNRQSGEIADADILLDDAEFDFCLSDCEPGQNHLCNTLTHEVGHLLGMDHSQEPEATMFATAPPGEQKKCSLADDDRQGICQAYRTACSGQGCPGPGPELAWYDCRAGRTSPGWAGAVLELAAALAAAALGRRRVGRVGSS